MNLTYKESFYKILAPIIGVVTVSILFNINSITFTRFAEIILFILAFSLLGALIIYILSILYEKYEKSIINKILERYKGEKANPNTIKFNYNNISVFFQRKKNIKLDQNEFGFHVPRKYIPKIKRKDMSYIKPSNVLQEECFQLKAWFYITDGRLKKIENILDELAVPNN